MASEMWLRRMSPYQLEKREHQHQQDKAGQNQDEDIDEFADDVLVKDARKDAAGRSPSARAAAGDRKFW